MAVLRGETTGFGLLLVCETWWLAALLAKAARLPLYARKSFTTVAALIAALPPLYDGIVELRTGGGWVESFVIMLLLLILVYRLTTRWHAGASDGELALRWVGVGFVVGFGLWIYPLVSVAILAAALWVVLDRVSEIVKHLQAAQPLLAACQKSLRPLLLAVTAIPACLIGFAPGILWGFQNNWANIHFIFGLGGGWNLQRLKTIANVSNHYVECVAPRVIGGGTPLEGSLLTIIHSPLLIMSLLCIFASLGLVLASLRWSNPLILHARTLAVLPTLLGGCSALLFCVSSASSSILISCNGDFGGRYASPLVLALPFFFATAFTLAGMLISNRSQRPEPPTDRDQPGAPRRGNSRLSVGVLVALCALLLVYLGGQAVTYGLTNPDLAFQSPYCTIAPANYGPIIAYMRQENIHDAWATNLLGYQISFETDNRIIIADPLPRVHPDLAINRIPAYTDAVASADRPSLLLFVKQGDTHPYLLQLLDSMHITYKAAFFPSQPGVDVMVVTPISQTVSPLGPLQVDLFYCLTK